MHAFVPHALDSNVLYALNARTAHFLYGYCMGVVSIVTACNKFPDSAWSISSVNSKPSDK